MRLIDIEPILRRKLPLLVMLDEILSAPSIEPKLILPERMERGECYEVGETIVVVNHDDYYDLLCKSMENKPKQGEWIPKEMWTEGVGMGEQYGRYYECSECHREYRGGVESCHNFCPNCGADMRKGPDDEL